MVLRESGLKLKQPYRIYQHSAGPIRKRIRTYLADIHTNQRKVRKQVTYDKNTHTRFSAIAFFYVCDGIAPTLVYNNSGEFLGCTRWAQLMERTVFGCLCWNGLMRAAVREVYEETAAVSRVVYEFMVLLIVRYLYAFDTTLD